MILWPFTAKLQQPTPSEAARAMANAGHQQHRARVLAVAAQMRADTAAGRVAKMGEGK